MTAKDMIEHKGLDTSEAKESLVEFFGHECAVEILAEHIDEAGLHDSFAEWLEENHTGEIEDQAESSSSSSKGWKQNTSSTPTQFSPTDDPPNLL